MACSKNKLRHAPITGNLKYQAVPKYVGFYDNISFLAEKRGKFPEESIFVL
jgi:hypothetical protein